jgi:hypothetical protein
VTWITRERPKIDRIACPWLVARFIDAAPKFVFVPSEAVFDEAERLGAIPYDIPGAELSHRGELCSFDAFLADYGLNNPALRHLATIVRGADTGRLDLAPQAAGLLAISLGLSANFADDHEMLARGLILYDALYEWCRSCHPGDARLAAGGPCRHREGGMTTTIATSVRDTHPPARPSLGAATKVWAKIGLLSFGGPAGQIALMHRTLVEERRWVGEQRFLHA